MDKYRWIFLVGLIVMISSIFLVGLGNWSWVALVVGTILMFYSQSHIPPDVSFGGSMPDGNPFDPKNKFE